MTNEEMLQKVMEMRDNLTTTTAELDNVKNQLAEKTKEIETLTADLTKVRAYNQKLWQERETAETTPPTKPPTNDEENFKKGLDEIRKNIFK